MTVAFQEYPTEGIILCTLGLPHDPMGDVNLTLEKVADYKKQVGKQVYRIVDLSKFNLTFSEAMMGMGAELNKEGGVNDSGVWTIYVGTGEWVQFGVKAFNEQAQYGKTYVLHVCESVDEGIAFARDHIAGKK